MGLYDDVNMMWTQNQTEFRKLLIDWIEGLEKKAEKLHEDRRKFHSWSPLEVYVSLSDIKSGNFSLRFQGQEVAKLRLDRKGKTVLVLGRDHVQNNGRWRFNRLGTGAYAWDGPEAKEMRRHFKDPSVTGNKPRVGEHGIECSIIRQMRARKAKFGGTFKWIKPVMLENCPFQMPLPISASRGKPKATNGHIDILARRGVGKTAKLSLWELKDVGKLPSTAIRQAYIYALTLLLMLREDQRWWSVFGRGGEIPASLEIEAVVAVSQDMEGKLLKIWQDGRADLRCDGLGNGNDKIKFYGAYYTNGAKAMTMNIEPLS